MTEETAKFSTDITSKSELKELLVSIKEKLSDGSAAAVYAASALNHVMNIPECEKFLDKENKELSRDLWLRIEKSGLNVDRPPMLFS